MLPIWYHVKFTIFLIAALLKGLASDLDQLFPERVHDKTAAPRDQSTGSTTESPVTSPDEHSSIRSAESHDSNQELLKGGESTITDTSCLLGKGKTHAEFAPLSVAVFFRQCIINAEGRQM